MPGVEYGPGRPEHSRVLLQGEKNLKKAQKAGKLSRRSEADLKRTQKRLSGDYATKKISKQLEDLSMTKKMTAPRRERLNKLGVLNKNGNFNAQRDVRVRKLMGEAASLNAKKKASKVGKVKKAKAKAAKARRKSVNPAKKAKKVAKRAR